MQEILDELRRADFGILLLTRENLGSEWMLFEAGALEMRGVTVAPILLDVEIKDLIKSPLGNLQAAKAAASDDLRKLLTRINSSSKSPHPDQWVTSQFHRLWGDFRDSIDRIIESAPATEIARDHGVVLEELVALVRGLDQPVPPSSAPPLKMWRRVGRVSFWALASYPSPLLVGAMDVPAYLLVVNHTAAPLILDKIRLTPACGCDDIPCPAGKRDPTVFAVKGVSPEGKAVGSKGTAAEGMTFTITCLDESTGEVSFIPDEQRAVLLDPAGMQLDTCRIDFAIDVRTMPTCDSSSSLPGVQTMQLVRVSGISATSGVIGTAAGASEVTILTGVRHRGLAIVLEG